jgi:cob(I)alamin adenosyltransferase
LYYPAGIQSVSFGHIARTVCRRAERAVIHLQQGEEVEPIVIRYLNRLSDYLFMLCRIMTHELEIEEVTWQPRLSRQKNNCYTKYPLFIELIF